MNDIFAATATTTTSGKFRQEPPHPARKLIVAIIAAKTMGKGKRKVRTGPRDGSSLQAGSRIASTTFWKMFDAYCARVGGGEGECGYPEAGANDLMNLMSVDTP